MKIRIVFGYLFYAFAAFLTLFQYLLLYRGGVMDPVSKQFFLMFITSVAIAGTLLALADGHYPIIMGLGLIFCFATLIGLSLVLLFSVEFSFGQYAVATYYLVAYAFLGIFPWFVYLKKKRAEAIPRKTFFRVKKPQLRRRRNRE
ncbi:MAG: hypothetical protein AAF514_03595 [Verrucomicrobiota bacterium]